MKYSILFAGAMFALASLIQTAWAQPARVPQIHTNIGDRPASVPQSYYDAVAAEMADPNMHPSLGPFSVSAVKSGNWSDPTLWSTGSVPGANATVNLGSHDVTYDISSTIKIKYIHNSADGVFRRAPGSVLWVNTQMFHGKYIEGEPGSPIPASNPTETVYWGSDDPGPTVKFGLVSMGGARMRGEAKAHFLNAATDLTSGSSTIQLNGVSGANWQVGDEILIAATESAGNSSSDPTYMGPTSYDGVWNGADYTETQVRGFRNSEDEPRTITAINGNTITLNAPLAYDHLIYSTTLPRGENVTVRPYVVNFTRSIQHRAEVASAVLQERPHMMFMHNDDVEIRYVDILNFGRTSTDPSLHVPSGKKVFLGSTDLADTDNVRGRYGLHIHGTGPYFGRKMVVVQGVVVRGENGPSMSAIPVPGWGIVHHNSRAAIEDCITYNVRGAGIVSELGNEIGQWYNNLSIWNRGDGFRTSWSSRQETHDNHNGHQGVAFESQARGILQQNNVAISSRFGWMFHQQNTNKLARVPDKFSLRFKDPLTEGGKAGYTANDHGYDNDTYGIEQDQIHDFHDNHCLNVGTGFFVAHRQMTDRTDQSVMIAKRFHCINTSTPFDLENYTFYYSFYDSYWEGNGNSTASRLGGNTHGMMFVNLHLEDFGTGFKDNHLGLNYNGFWIDIDFTNVSTPFDNSTVYETSLTDTPSNHPLWGVMGPWNITDNNNPSPGFTAQVRVWDSISSASLPSPYPLAPFGLSGAIPPGASAPEFVLDSSSDITANPNGLNTISLSGVIVDHVGVRKWPDGYVTFTPIDYWHQAMGAVTNHDTTGIEMVEMNGCFNDNGTWKCRLWFNLDERRDGEYLQFPIDIELVGFDTAFLNANIVDPNAIKPDLPLKLESIVETPIGSGIDNDISYLDGTDVVLGSSDVSSYSNQDVSGSANVAGDGSSVTITGNAWKKVPLSYYVTANTMIRFTVEASDVGEIIGIGLDENDDHQDAVRVVQIGGSQAWAGAYQITQANQYTAGSGPIQYEINIGNYYTGTMRYLVFAADDDQDASSNVAFSDIEIYEGLGSGSSNVLTIEAESLAGSATFSPFVVSGDYAVVSNGTGNVNSSSVTDPDGILEFEFVLSDAADVSVAIHVDFASGTDDSFWRQMNGSSWVLQNGSTASVHTYQYNNLSAGSHTFRIARREDGAKFDNVILTTSFGSISEDAPPAGSPQITIEAESASGQSSFSPFTVSGNYAVVPNGTGMVNGSSVTNANGIMTYDFTLSEATNVTIDAHVNFPSGNDDSFWHRVDGGSYTVQNYDTSSVITLNYNGLSAGTHTLSIARREDGAAFDYFEITPQSGTVSQ